MGYIMGYLYATIYDMGMCELYPQFTVVEVGQFIIFVGSLVSDKPGWWFRGGETGSQNWIHPSRSL